MKVIKIYEIQIAFETPRPQVKVIIKLKVTAKNCMHFTRHFDGLTSKFASN